MIMGRIRFARSIAAASVPLFVASCAVGPDFQKPAAPTVASYTDVPISGTNGTASVTGGEAQRFIDGRDIPADWWTLFHSEPLNDLIELSLKNNPDIKAGQAALAVARENVLAQKGAYYPSVGAGFSASRQRTSNEISPTPNSGDLYFSLYTPQVSVSYVPDVFGLNQRTVESLNAQAEQADLLLWQHKSP
jgi:outer membrane protein TolC